MMKILKRKRIGGRAAKATAAATMLASAAIGAAAPALASETITYSYDARGRLVQVARSGTVNNGVTTSYTYDKAHNRTNKTTSGSPNSGPP